MSKVFALNFTKCKYCAHRTMENPSTSRTSSQTPDSTESEAQNWSSEKRLRLMQSLSQQTDECDVNSLSENIEESALQNIFPEEVMKLKLFGLIYKISV